MRRRWLLLLLPLLLLGGLGLYGQQACPAPAWAFWRTTTSEVERVNFAFLECVSSTRR